MFFVVSFIKDEMPSVENNGLVGMATSVLRQDTSKFPKKSQSLLATILSTTFKSLISAYLRGLLALRRLDRWTLPPPPPHPPASQSR